MTNKINYLQLSSIFFIGIFTSFLGVGFLGLIKFTKIDGWLSVIITSLIGIIFICLFIYIFNYEPDLPVNQKIIKLFGKKIGFIINSVIFIVTLIIGISMMYNLTNFIVSQFLSETPLFLIGFLFSMIIAYANIKGIETISRTSLILLVINLIMFVISTIGLTPTTDLNNFKPFLEDGYLRPIIGSLYLLAINILPFFIILMVPKNQIVQSKHYKKYFIFTYILVSILMLVTVVNVIGNLGIELASNYQYPEYIVLKRLNIFNFLDRIENIIVTQWIFGLFMTITYIVYYLSNTIKNNHQSKLLPIIITGIILYLSLKLFPNNTSFNQYSYYIAPYIRGTFALIFILVSLKIKFQKKISTSK